MSDILDGELFHVHHGDAITHMAELPPACFDMSVFSPPFPSLYSYTDSEEDIGNSEDLEGAGKIHLSFFYRQLARIIKPGRVIMVHVAQIPNMKRTGGQGLSDFRGLNIRLARRAGLVYEYDWLIRKNPQSQALRTKSRELQFQGLETDRARSRGAICDYLIKFMVPGTNAVPVNEPGEISRNDWVHWAEGAWLDIQESDTLNVAEARGPEDTRHICALQCEVSRRLILLCTNPGEIVFSPFAGIGSEGFMALGGTSPKTGKRIAKQRRFYGCELKDEYHAAALRNCARAVAQHKEESRGLFDEIDSREEASCP